MNTYNSRFTGNQIKQMVNFVHTQVAESFNVTKEYIINNFVMYNGGLLYQCIEDTTAGAFVPTQWRVQRIFDNDSDVIISEENETPAYDYIQDGTNLLINNAPYNQQGTKLFII